MEQDFGLGGRLNHYDKLIELEALVGQELGVSDWITVDQSMIDTFAKTTLDEQWIHVDPERAAKGPFGSPIAHGFLTLSLHSALIVTAFRVTQAKMGVNSGFDRVRFTAPVKVGKRIRGHFVLKTFELIEGGAKMALDTTIEVEGESKPACLSTWLVRQYI